MRFLRDRVVQVSGAVVLLAVLVAVVWSSRTPDSPTDDDRIGDPPTSLAGAEAVALDEVDDLDEVVGRRVVADRVQVESVPADEGFWVDAGGERAWVQLTTAGESPFAVQPGQRVSFVGEVVAHGPDFAERPEFSAIDAEELVNAGAHIEVPLRDVEIDSSG